MVRVSDLPPEMTQRLRDFPVEHLVSGVYLLVKDGAIVYVGQSVNVPSRLGSHALEKDFDRAVYMPVVKEDLDAVEGALIRHLEPPLNGRGPNAGRDDEVLLGLGLRDVEERRRARLAASAKRQQERAEAAADLRRAATKLREEQRAAAARLREERLVTAARLKEERERERIEDARRQKRDLERGLRLAREQLEGVERMCSGSAMRCAVVPRLVRKRPGNDNVWWKAQRHREEIRPTKMAAGAGPSGVTGPEPPWRDELRRRARARRRPRSP